MYDKPSRIPRAKQMNRATTIQSSTKNKVEFSCVWRYIVSDDSVTSTDLKDTVINTQEFSPLSVLGGVSVYRGVSQRESLSYRGLEVGCHLQNAK